MGKPVVPFSMTLK